MDEMGNAQISEFFVKHLSEAEDPDQLIMEICDRTGRGWTEVEELLRRVQEEKRQEITLKQLPILVPLAFVLFIGGLALSGISIYSLALSAQTEMRDVYGFPDLNSAILKSFTSGTSPLVDFLYAMLRFLYLTLINPLFLLLAGIAMISGSLFGMRDVWKNILNL